MSIFSRWHQARQNFQPPIDPRLVDHARRILVASDIDDEDRADLWDAYHGTKNSAELARHLQSVAAPDELKRQLLDAKKLTDSEPSAMDQVVAAIQRMAQIDPKVLDQAERYLKVTGAHVDAATRSTR